MSSREGIIEDVFSLLLKQLADVKRKNGSPTSEVQKQLLGEIENEVRGTKDIFCRVRLWERDVTDEFGAVAKHIDDILEDGGSDFQSKLEGIEQQILKIKELVTPPLKLPPVESSTRSPSSSSGPSTTTTTDQFHIMSGEWRQFELDDKILESSALTNLQVSYDNLGIQLKLCLLCFSVFPENSVIKRRPLIYWWIGEGMVTPTRSNTAEEVGGGCFRELIYKGLIEPIYRKHSPVVDRCRMHPWIRRMLISVARKARFFDFDSEGNPTSDAFGSRRACLVGTERQGSAPQRPGLGAAQSNPEELLTLFNVNEHYLRLGKDWFAELRKVAVLQLGRWQTSAKHHIEVEDTEFLKGLGSCEHLRYLCLQGISRITELPDSIGGISNLRVLDLRACHNLEKLTVGITSLKKLTHLDVSECYLIEHMPKGIGSLSELQVLKGFVIGNSRSKDPCRLHELARLEKLRKLSIDIGSEAAVAKGELDELKRLKALRSLTITWGMVSFPSKEGTRRLTRLTTMTMESLSLPTDLEKLDLRCFPSEVAPKWLSPSDLKSLKRLYIRGGKLSSLCPVSSAVEKWNVEVLRLRFLRELRLERRDLRAAFPHLVFLEIHKCDRLESLKCDAEGVWSADERENGNPSSRSSNAIIP